MEGHMKRQIQATAQVVRKSDELGILWGYVSASGIVDGHGDVIPRDELVQAFYAFMEAYHAGKAEVKENHTDSADVVIVESTLHNFGPEVAWFVGVKLLSDDLRKAARDGEISGFSIGGWANFEEDGDGQVDEPAA